MKGLKVVTIFLLSAILVVVAVVFSINGYHTDEGNLLGNYCTVSEYGYSVDDVGDYSFDESKDLYFTGNFYNNLFKDEVFFEVRDTDGQLYWVRASLLLGGEFEVLHPGSQWSFSSVGTRDLYSIKTKFFIAINSLLILFIASPFMIGLALCKNKKIFIILLSIIGAIIVAVLIFLVYTFVDEFGWIIAILVILYFLSECFTIVFII